MRGSFLAEAEQFLKRRTAIVGVGNVFKGDDGIGPLLISRLQGKTKACLFDCGEVPENYFQPIIKSQPEVIFIVDASDWAGEVGQIRLIKKEEIQNFGFSTHDASLGLFLDYLKKELPLTDIVIIGIQAGSRGLSHPISPQVEVAINKLANFFMKA